MELMIALGFGFFLGFILQKSHVIRFDNQVNFLLGKDMRLIRCYATAMAVGMFGIALFYSADMIALKVVPTNFFAQILGGLLFGLGWAFAGYCPITTFGSLGEGRLDAMWPLVGLVLGGILFVFSHSWLQQYMMPIGIFGEITIADLVYLPHFFTAMVCIFLIVVFFKWLQKVRKD